ncbi:MAG: Na+/H+ antiporter [Devosia sp.]|uniref:Na+/H+ antiporter n=1 Tax=Devosia sp. TaxID=1871048 RepID=UPI0033925977
MFAEILIVIIVAIGITAFAERSNFQPALLVAIVGLGASFIPGLHRLELEPEIILGIVLPPLLFSAASDFSFTSFAKRLGSIVNLGVFLVFASAVTVAVVATWTVPGMPITAALVLGAIVAPPDAVTAIAIGSKAGLPSGLMTVLKGESLINDAAALTLLAVAVATTAGTHAFIDNTALYFLYAAVVGVLLGLVIGHSAQFARRRLANPSLATVISVLVPFAAYLMAEELHASGVLAVVAAGFALGHHGTQSGYEERMQERQFWRTIDTLLETFVFAYIGLQLRFVIDDAFDAGLDISDLLLAGVAIFVTTVAVRFAWVFATAVLARRRHRAVMQRLAAPRRHTERLPPPTPETPLTWKENAVLSWTGMRGVVTLAAAAGIPFMTVSGDSFPYREAIIALAFLVTIATLLVQGISLPWLIERLSLEDEDDKAYAEVQHQLARRLAHEANADALAEFRRTHTSPRALRLADAMAKRADRTSVEEEEDEAQERGWGFDREEAFRLGQTLLDARRKRLIAARDARELDDMVLREVLEQMDLEQALMDGMTKGANRL